MMTRLRTRLVFVRHGESVHQIESVVGGPRGCRGLTERGHQQARRLAGQLTEELAGASPVAVYSSVLRRAVETARPIAEALGTASVEHCGLCTWHTPAAADGMPTARFQRQHRADGGGVFRPFEDGNESWAELVVRTSRAIMDLAHRHRGGTVVLVGHTETVESSFHALAAQPLLRAFDLAVTPGSVTEWVAEDMPTAWPPPRWTLRRFNDVR
ncbi:histidine phosphatase family protein [Micromonospora sp. NPDC126480]|uniref:histidine phosphatase family protein n=1 Tax=Micromonospora sp. NPDC126480 TaxID=3155312 RepID=UPI003332FFD5